MVEASTSTTKNRHCLCLPPVWQYVHLILALMGFLAT